MSLILIGIIVGQLIGAIIWNHYYYKRLLRDTKRSAEQIYNNVLTELNKQKTVDKH